MVVDDGYAQSKAIKVDDRGNMLEAAFLGADGKPIVTPLGARTATKFDEHNNPVEMDGFGLDGKPILTKQGWAKQLYEYDERETAARATV